MTLERRPEELLPSHSRLPVERDREPMPIIDDTRGVSSRPQPRVVGPYDGPRHAGPVATLDPDPRSGVAKERARLKREHPEAWER